MHSNYRTTELGNVFKSLIIAAGLLTTLLSPAHASFNLSGTISGQKPGSHLNLFREDLDKRSQSLEEELLILADGTFNHSFDSEPGLFKLITENKTSIPLAIREGQTVNVTINTRQKPAFKIEGSSDTDALIAYERFRKESLSRLVLPPRSILHRARSSNVSAEKLEALAQKEVDAYQAHLRELNDFTIDTTGPSIALYATSLRWNGDYRRKELETIVADFTKANPDLAITHSMQERLKSFSSIAIGAIAPPLSGVDFEGNAHSLNDLKGKFVLIDFWASWCSPCRVENQFYVKMKNKYSTDEFEIFAVSIDTNKANWKRASQRDKITWPQISDYQAWKSPLASAYNVSSLPANFLLDPQGRIIARNLRGPELSAKLDELLRN